VISKEIFGNLLFTEKFISKAACMSFPLDGNLSEKEGFRTSQNDRNRSSGCFFTEDIIW